MSDSQSAFDGALVLDGSANARAHLAQPSVRRIEIVFAVPNLRKSQRRQSHRGAKDAHVGNLHELLRITLGGGQHEVALLDELRPYQEVGYARDYVAF